MAKKKKNTKETVVTPEQEDIPVADDSNDEQDARDVDDSNNEQDARDVDDSNNEQDDSNDEQDARDVDDSNNEQDDSTNDVPDAEIDKPVEEETSEPVQDEPKLDETLKPTLDEPKLEDGISVDQKDTKEVLSGVTSEQASVAAMLTMSDVQTLLQQQGMSIEDKLSTISGKAVPAFKHMTAKLLGYHEAMGQGMVKPELGVGKQFDLLNTITSIVETKDYNEFKTKFDILNLVFLNHKDTSYNVYKLFRFSEKWKWSKKQLATFQALTSTIALLAPLVTRKDNIKKIDFKTALDIKNTTLTADAAGNIEKYYKA